MMMIQTRRQEILTILKQQGEATVDELATMLELTPVTVRHHLDILRAEGLVEAPAVRRRHGPGRPQYVYTLTPESADLFPQRYDVLANELLDEIKSVMDRGQVREILDHIVEHRVRQAPPLNGSHSIDEQMDTLVGFLSERGFIAEWDKQDSKVLLYASNCPYQNVASRHPEICAVDQLMLERLTGAHVHCVRRITDGAYSCIYQIEFPNG
jgi:DeoR family transcriptional regulator, suf operon transcriptional repressor